MAGRRASPTGLGFVVLVEVGAELLDGLVVVRTEIGDDNHVRTCPVSPGVLPPSAGGIRTQ